MAGVGMGTDGIWEMISRYISSGKVGKPRVLTDWIRVLKEVCGMAPRRFRGAISILLMRISGVKLVSIWKLSKKPKKKLDSRQSDAWR